MPTRAMPFGEHIERGFFNRGLKFALAGVRTRDLQGANRLLSPLGLATLGIEQLLRQ